MVIMFVMFHKNMWFPDHSVLLMPAIGNCLLNSSTSLLRNQVYDDPTSEARNSVIWCPKLGFIVEFCEK